MAREVRVAILGDSRDFSRAVSSARGDASRLDRAFSGIGDTAVRMGKAVAIGIGGLAVGGAALAKGFIDAAVESQKVTAQTEAVLKSMGDSANVTAKQVADLSTKLSMQSGIDDELIQSGSNILLTFGKLRNGTAKTDKVFDRATQAALDMSVALGTDMTSASMIVGKALNDPIRGLTALRRSGIQFTKAQEDQIRVMVNAGDVMGAQKVMLSELERQFGGSAAAQATAGDKLKVVWGNLQEQLGEKLLPIFNQVAEWLSSNLPRAIDAASPYVAAFFEAVGGFISDVAPKIKDFVQDKLQALSDWWTDHGPAITEAAKGFAEDFDEYVLKPMGKVATFVVDELVPKLGEFITWILEHEDVMKGLGTLVGVTLVAHFVALGVAAIASAFATAAAWAAAVLPITAMILTVGALAVAMDWIVRRPEFSQFVQFFIDLAEGAWDLANALSKVVPLLAVFISMANSAFSALDSFTKATGIGPKEATRNPLLPDKPKTSRAQGGVVPGAFGQPMPILAHGGEVVSTRGQQMRGGGSGGPQTIVVQLGTQEFARFVVDAQTGAVRRGVG